MQNLTYKVLKGERPSEIFKSQVKELDMISESNDAAKLNLGALKR